MYRIHTCIYSCAVFHTSAFKGRETTRDKCIILNTLHNATQFTIKHSSYKNATTGYLIVWLTCLNITLAPSPIPSRITHSLFGIIISLGGMQFLRHAQDIVWQFTLLHIAQCHDKKSEYSQICFPCTGSGQQYAHRQETIDTTVLSPHGAARPKALAMCCVQEGCYSKLHSVQNAISRHIKTVVVSTGRWAVSWIRLNVSYIKRSGGILS